MIRFLFTRKLVFELSELCLFCSYPVTRFPAICSRLYRNKLTIVVLINILQLELCSKKEDSLISHNLFQKVTLYFKVTFEIVTFEIMK